MPMSEYIDDFYKDFDESGNGERDRPDPGQDKPEGKNSGNNSNKGKNKCKFKITPLSVVMAFCMAILFTAPFLGHYMVYQPVFQWGKDVYLSELGLIAWFFSFSGLESMAVSDGVTGILSFMSVLLSEMFFHFLMIEGYLEHREYFWSNPTRKLETFMTFGLYICTLVIEGWAMYLRMGMNAMIQADPSNPLFDFKVHGYGELFGFSAMIIFINATFSYLSIKCFRILKKEIEQ